MAFDTDFWVVTGTAAPVIALTAVVAGNQAKSMITETPGWHDFLADQAKWVNENDPGSGIQGKIAWWLQFARQSSRRNTRKYTNAAGLASEWAGRISSANLILQSIVLLLSLLGLAWHRSLAWPWIVAMAEVASMWLLVLAGWFGVSARTAVLLEDVIAATSPAAPHTDQSEA